MVTIKAIIKKYGRKGEKTGWTYVDVAQKQAQKIKADYKRSYKVKGHIDSLEVTQLTMVPMGEGNFIIPLKSEIRKMIKKELGDTVVLKLVEDTKEYQLDKELLVCLKEEPVAFLKFKSYSRSHQNYYSKWVGSAKTSETKSRRIGLVINGLILGQTYAEMLRANRELVAGK